MNQPFKSRYINVFNESDLIPTHDGDKHIDDLISNYEKSLKQDSKENDLFAGCSVSVESYETNSAKLKNKKFHEFQKKVSLLPEQVIRYNYGGKPLLLSDFDETTVIPKCVCGKPLVFEFQLMPSMIPYLQLDGEDSVEFGTILVYTCSSSCWGEGVSQEIGGHVVYCPDPDLKFFKSQSFGTTENANK
uniref:Programmed cell death protein 2 C-terminal domain-containing protein n=1 Tax=Ciona savignyi TaxID=51511 RepID=H2Z143_CIOSA